MNNMGGIRKLYYIDADDFVSLVEGENELHTLTLDEEAVLNDLKFTHDTGKISQNEEETDNGTVYNFETSCRIPKCGPAKTSLLKSLSRKRLFILAEDNNENFWLAGCDGPAYSSGTYFRVNINSTSGEGTQDTNSMQLNISAQLTSPCVFIKSPF